MSTEETWVQGLEGALRGARDWVERPGAGPSGLPEAGDGRLRAADPALEVSPAFISFIETMCGGDRICLKRLLDTLERLIIIRALHRSRGNQRTAAANLGLKYTTLNEKVKKHGLRISKKVQSIKPWTEL